MKTFTSYLPRLFFAGVLAILIVIFRSALMTYLVGPIVSVFWLLWRVVSSVNQSSYWFLVIVLFLVLLIFFIPSKSNLATQNESQTIEKDEVNRHIEEWHSLISSAAADTTARDSLRRSLLSLLVSSVSQIERIDPVKAQEELVSKIIPLPPAIYTCLFPQEGTRAGSVGQWIWRRIIRSPRDSQVEIGEVLEWIETYLEKKHAD